MFFDAAAEGETLAEVVHLHVCLYAMLLGQGLKLSPRQALQSNHPLQSEIENLQRRLQRRSFCWGHYVVDSTHSSITSNPIRISAT